MGVTIRKKDGKWFVFINYQGRRKAKCVGTSRQLAEQVKHQLEGKLILGDLGLMSESPEITLKEYSDRWLEQYAEMHLKPSTVASYRQLLRLFVLPKFGQMKLKSIERDQIKSWLADMSHQSLSKNTLRLMLATLRVILNHAIEDHLIDRNPADKLGRFAKTDKPKREASAMTREEAQQFLQAVLELSPAYYPLFLVSLRAGLRRGELIALRWGDIQFGADENDSNRYLLVQRNYVHGQFTTPKSKKSRRVDLSKQLRQILLQIRDARLVDAYAVGKATIADDLVFPSRVGTVLDPDNLYHYHFLPALAKAGLRKFRLHDLRHTYGSLLIQSGASLAYVKEQMGHSSIQVTADVYGHLIPGANVSWVDGLDSELAKAQPATPAQPKLLSAGKGEGQEQSDVFDSGGDKDGERGRNRTYNLLIKSLSLCCFCGHTADMYPQSLTI